MKTNQKVPEGWSVKKLGDVCYLIAGNAFDSNDFVQEGIPLIRISNIDEDKIVLNENTVFLKESFLKENEKFKVQYNDLLIAMSGATTGKMGINTFLEPMLLNQRVCIIRAKNISQNYLNQYLFTHKKDILKQSYGGAQPNIGNNDIKKIKLLLPPLCEQEKIAEILGTWDLAIEKLTALIEQKKLLKKGLMQRLLNFKKEYLKRFDEIFEDYSDKKHSDKDLLSATQENGVIPRRLLKGRVMSPEGSLDGYKLVQSGSFVISLRSFQGGLEYSDYEGIISPAYTVLKDKISINKCFYRYFFKSYNFIEKYLSIAVIGIRDGKQISYPDLQSVKIPYPPLSEQKAIADILSKADEEIDLLTRKLSALKEQKTGLMQQLLTGKIRVKVA